MYYIGIDPGFTGAITILDSNMQIVDIHDAPTLKVPYSKKTRTEFNVKQMVNLLTPYIGQKACIESVTARSGQGVTSMFRFGHGLGLWEGILSALNIEYIKVLPVEWKKHYGFIGSGKQLVLQRIRELFPASNSFRLQKHHNRAESYYLALYCYYIHTL